MKRIDTWTTSSALNDKQGNKSSYGAGSTDHQFQASSCLNDRDEANRKDFSRLFRIISSLLPTKVHHAFQVGKYSEGHFIDAHDDAAYLDIVDITDKVFSNTSILVSRDIAMVFYLTKDWSADNGGCFIDLVGGEGRNNAVPCGFNDLAFLLHLGAEGIDEINFPAHPFAGGILGGEGRIGFRRHADLEVCKGRGCRQQRCRRKQGNT